MQNIKSLSIEGFLGIKDVFIPFDNNVKILIGENGIGKTQILNTLYFAITRDYKELNNFIFDKVIVNFDDTSIEIRKKDLDFLTNNDFSYITENILYFKAPRNTAEIYGYKDNKHWYYDTMHGKKSFYKYSNRISMSLLASIQSFIDVCNKYLIDKKCVNYSKNIIELFIMSENGIINLNQLSFSERQIITIFSKLYLERTNKFIILFDEPELSLSINWQRMLLPDIMKSNQCSFLLATTHSPFIFDNEFDVYTVGLNEYFQK